MFPWYATRSAGGYSSSQVVQSQGQELIGNETYFLLKPEEALSIYQSNYNAMYKHGVRNVGLGDFGFVLFSDYSTGIKSRSQNIETIRDFLKVAQLTSVEKPFDYLWSADVITDIPMYSSQQLKFTDTVPFIPIVLSGYKHVYGRSANFFANTSNELLRMVDYHIFPNFFLTNESATLLLNTSSNTIFTSRFGDWKDEIIRQYNFVNDALKHVINAQFTSRKVLMPGVVRNTYNNGVTIYINYTGSLVNVDGLLIDAMSYEVKL